MTKHLDVATSENYVLSQELYFSYKEECCANGRNYVGHTLFGRILKNIFPSIVYKEIGYRGPRAYFGVKWMLHPTFVPFHAISFDFLNSYHGVSLRRTDSCYEIEFLSDVKVNGLDVKKTLRLNQDFTWNLFVMGDKVSSDNIIPQLENTYSSQQISSICNLVSALKICQGRDMPKSAVISRLTVERFFQDGCDKRKTRALKCTKVLPLLATSEVCCKCQRVQIINAIAPSVSQVNKVSAVPVKSQEEVSKECDDSSPVITNADSSVFLSVDDSTDLDKIIDMIIPNASDELKILIKDQRKSNIVKDKRGMRWNKEVIRACLGMYCRSPAAYEDFKSRGFLKLPSGKLLSMYKNSVKQMPGLRPEVFQWMLTTAQVHNLKDQCGGLILDEMRIQKDLTVERSGETFSLLGFTNTGAENDCVKDMMSRTNGPELANYVMQFSFLSFDGFRFPFCHYPTNQATCTEINNLVWEAIDMLESYGFSVMYINTDGALQNRQFIKMNFHNVDPCEAMFLCPNPVMPDQKVAFIMDYSHSVKKIRNSIIGSLDGGVRYLTNSEGKNITWSMWKEAYAWDCRNVLPLHRKLSAAHFSPSDSEKMRNHLAEEVLNADMLYLFKAYVSSLPVAKQEDYSFVLEFLKHTADLIAVFRDPRPMTRDDERFEKLKVVWKFFKSWERNAKSPKHLITAETRYDLDITILGFVGLVRYCHVTKPDKKLRPSQINSDVIENHFCQMRGEEKVKKLIYPVKTSHPTLLPPTHFPFLPVIYFNVYTISHIAS